MSENNPSLFDVSIEFSKSHLFFPNIILWILAGLFVLIVILYGGSFFRDIKSGKRKIHFFCENYDKFRLISTFILLPAYIYMMDVIGEYYPNSGLGFLLATIPFMLILSLIYVHNLDRKKALIIVINSALSPLFVWYTFGTLFNISLP